MDATLPKPAPIQMSTDRTWFDRFIYIIMSSFLIGMMAVDTYPWLNNINRILGSGLVIAYLFRLPSNFRILPLELLIFLFWMFWVATTGFAVAKDKSLFIGLVRNLSQQWLMMAAVAGLTVRWSSPRWPFQAVITSALGLCAYIVATGEYAHGLQATRVKGLLANANSMGLIMLTGVVSTLYFWNSHHRSIVQRLLLLGIVLLMSFMIILSASRKHFLSLLILLTLWLYFCHRPYLLRHVKFFLLGLLTVCSLYWGTSYVLKHTYLGKRIETVTEAGQGRFTLYKDAWGVFLNAPITGVGLDNFRRYSRSGLEAHSSYMEILTDTGFVGFIAYYLLFFILWRRIAFIRAHSSGWEDLYYAAGLFKAFLITYLILGLVVPTFKSLYLNFVLASIIGHTTTAYETIRHATMAAGNAFPWRDEKRGSFENY